MRRRTTPRAAESLTLLILGAWSLPALAAPGDHIRAGDSVITPSVMTGLEYHSNVYLTDGSASAPTFGGAAWLLHPRFSLDLEGADLQLNMGAGWGMRKYIDLDVEDTPHLENLDRYTDVDANLGIAALNHNVLGLRLDDRFEIQNSPAELPTSGENANIAHLSNDLNAGVAVRPGSALELNVLGNVGFDSYTVPDALIQTYETSGSINNRANYGPVLDVRWKFLPKTSFLFNASYNVLRWKNNLIEALGPEVEGADYGQYIGKPDASSWRTSLGVKGQFTSKLALAAEVGYGQMYYDEASVVAPSEIPESSADLQPVGEETFARDLTSFGEGVTVNTQVAYAPVRGHTVTAGYRKDFQDAFFTNYVVYNNAYLRYEGLFASRFGVTGEFNYRIDNFHGEVARNDQNIRLKVNGAYRFNDYLSANLGGGWTERACLAADCENGVFFPTQYDDVWASGGVTFTY